MNGRLVRRAEGLWVQVGGGRSHYLVGPGQLAPALASRQRGGEALEGVSVDFDPNGMAAERVRPAGEPWPRPGAPAGRGAGSPPGPPPVPAGSRAPGRVLPPRARFHNPYNFVPAPPRVTADPDLGDHAPAGHHRYDPDLWTGWIDVEMTVVTPLLVPDVGEEQANGHWLYGARQSAAGDAHIPPTTVKGMLRGAFEAVTNSRFGVFERHERPLGFRRSAESARDLRPVRLTSGPEGLVPELLTAAPIGFYPKPLLYPDETVPRHGDEVVCRIGGSGRGPQRVQAIGRRGEVLPGTGQTVEGWVFITNRNIGHKKHERVFYRSGPPRRLRPLSPAVIQGWQDLIADYRAQHTDEDIQHQGRGAPDVFLGPDIGDTAWSPHLFRPEAGELRDGTLCYASVEENAVRSLYPVLVSRSLYEKAPAALLHPSLRPATALEELSPADRVFGWSHPAGEGAWRGSLRLGPVRPVGAGSLEDLGPQGVALAILSAPKPAQARFYVARDAQGTPLSDGTPTSPRLYGGSSGLRGRKVYPHHRNLPSGYWHPGGAALPGRWRNYLRGEGQRDRQNHSVRAWVPPGTAFRFRLEVTNLRAAELGGLLWLLDLGADRQHRVGGGKPLGFGSVTLAVSGVRLQTGRALSARYRSLDREVGAPEDPRASLLEAFTTAVARTAGVPDHRQAPWIAAFLRAAEGFDDDVPVHYPRTGPEPQDESFEWFVANNGGNRFALPSLRDDPGLPLNPRPPRPPRRDNR